MALAVALWATLLMAAGAGAQDPPVGPLEDDPRPIRLESVATGLGAPVYVAEPDDGTGRLFIVDQVGRIHVLGADGDLRGTPFLDLSDRIVDLEEGYDERGLLGLAFHPDYADNGRLFVYYSAPAREEAPDGWDHTSRVAEFRVSPDDPDRADPDSERLVMAVDQPFPNHNGGHIAFGHDGYLHIPLGDGGNGGDIDPAGEDLGRPERGNGQALSTLLGAILRVDVDGDGDRTYEIPADNPFTDEPGVRSEIWAYGFRNPYGFTVDRETGDFWAADAGQLRWEEVSLVEPGGNHGWNIREGTRCFDPDDFSQSPDDCRDTGYRGEPLVDPLIEYARGPERGSVVVPAVRYRGDRMPEFAGAVVFGDYSEVRFRPNGVLYVADEADGPGTWPVRRLVVDNAAQIGGGQGTMQRFLLGIGQDLDGELYALTTGRGGPAGTSGEVFAIRSAAAADDDGVPVGVWLVGGGVLLFVLLAAALTARGARRRRDAAGGDDGAVRMAAAACMITLAVLAATACGGESGDAVQGDPVAGAQLLRDGDLTPTCGDCHALSAAGFEGRIGPDLDTMRPGYQRVLDAIREGPGTMPSYADRLSDRELRDIAAYVADAARP